jgi:hypothetical protein
MEHVNCVAERLQPVSNTSTDYDESNLHPKPGVGNLRHACQAWHKEKIFNGTLSELKYSNYDLIKKTEFLIQ